MSDPFAEREAPGAEAAEPSPPAEAAAAGESPAEAATAPRQPREGGPTEPSATPDTPTAAPAAISGTPTAEPAAAHGTPTAAPPATPDTPTAAPAAGASAEASTAADVALVARLLDEIRADVWWREEVARLRRTGGSAAPTGQPPADAARDETVPQLPPLPDVEPPPTTPPLEIAPRPTPGLAGTIQAIEAAIRAADAVVTIEPGRPVVGQLWAALRRQIHADARIYLDRQTSINLEILDALRRIERALDPGTPESSTAALWAAVAQAQASLGQRLDQLAAELAALRAYAEALAARVEADRARTGRLAEQVKQVEAAIAALAVEIEPLGELRVALAQAPQGDRRP